MSCHNTHRSLNFGLRRSNTDNNNMFDVKQV